MLDPQDPDVFDDPHSVILAGKFKEGGLADPDKKFLLPKSRHPFGTEPGSDLLKKIVKDCDPDPGQPVNIL